MHLDAVDDNLYVVGLIAVEHHAELNLAHLSIDAHTGEARLADMLKQLPIMSLAPSDCRGKYVDALVSKVFEDEVGNLLLGVAHHTLARIVGIGLTDAGVEQA